MIIFYTCFLTCIAIVASSEFSLKGDNCSQHDSCYSKSLIRTCSCDEDCDMYGNCCEDVKNPQYNLPVDTFRCYTRRTITPVFAKRSCSEDFKGHIGDISACLDEDEDEMDVKNNLLVTSHKTKITYWNNHCAVCNNEASADLAYWNIEVFCPKHKDVSRNLIRRNLTFDEDKSQWGLQIGDEFLQCFVKYAPPPYIGEVKFCTPNLIFSCPVDYNGKEIIKKCSRYYAERKLKNSETYYRNIHCAICNGANLRELECPGMLGPEDNAEETDFGEMVEEIFVQGNWLPKKPGEQFECSKGFTYDPFQVRCRRDPVEVVVPVDDVSHAIRRQSLSVLVAVLVLFVV